MRYHQYQISMKIGLQRHPAFPMNKPKYFIVIHRPDQELRVETTSKWSRQLASLAQYFYEWIQHQNTFALIDGTGVSQHLPETICNSAEHPHS